MSQSLYINIIFIYLKMLNVVLIFSLKSPKLSKIMIHWRTKFPPLSYIVSRSHRILTGSLRRGFGGLGWWCKLLIKTFKGSADKERSKTPAIRKYYRVSGIVTRVASLLSQLACVFIQKYWTEIYLLHLKVMLPHPVSESAFKFHNTYFGWINQCVYYKNAFINRLWQHDFWMKPKNFAVRYPYL